MNIESSNGVNSKKSNMYVMNVKFKGIYMYTEYWPVSDTTVSKVRELMWSKLNISGVGRGNGTFFTKNSRGVAIAYKRITQE